MNKISLKLKLKLTKQFLNSLEDLSGANNCLALTCTKNKEFSEVCPIYLFF